MVNIANFVSYGRRVARTLPQLAATEAAAVAKAVAVAVAAATANHGHGLWQWPQLKGAFSYAPPSSN